MPPPQDAGRKVVALVTSQGGIEALSRVLAPLPRDFPSAVIALQHVSPDRESLLAEILARRTVLEVRTAEQSQPLTTGVVHVAPAGQHTLVLPDRTLALIASGTTPPSRPSADLLLTSLAISVRTTSPACWRRWSLAGSRYVPCISR